MALSKVPGHSRSQGRSCSYVLPGIILLCFFFLTAIFLYYKMSFFLSAFKDVVPQLVLAMSSKDFFSRGLITKRKFLSISRNDLCGSIESAVDWGNANPSEAAAIEQGGGGGGEDLMDSLSMEAVP
ncbi:hypothetical protein WN943_026696 [Citrus x changshan-huyou]